jgi:hypothetical protein
MLSAVHVVLASSEQVASLVKKYASTDILGLYEVASPPFGQNNLLLTCDVVWHTSGHIFHVYKMQRCQEPISVRKCGYGFDFLVHYSFNPRPSCNCVVILLAIIISSSYTIRPHCRRRLLLFWTRPSRLAQSRRI